jgi:hypothetical protein
LAQIGKHTAIFAVIYSNAPSFKEFSQSGALAARTKKVDSNGRALLKFDMKPEDFLRMFIEKCFLY